MQAITGTEQTLMRTLWQRPTLYVAAFGAYRMLAQTDIKDATKVRDFEPSNWKPVLNIGGHRLAFVGEQVGFNAGNSFQTTFSSGKKRRADGQGYGRGHSIGHLNWNVTGPHGWSAYGVPFTNTVIFTPSQPGLYELSCSTQDGSAVTRRWIRVYPNRDTPDWTVTGVEGLEGSWGGGWSCSLTVQTAEFDLGWDATTFEDYQTIGVYAEDAWHNGAVWVHQNIGSMTDQRVVMIGYIREGSIQKDTETKTISFTLESIVGQMDRSMTHKTAIWNSDGPSDEDTDVSHRELRRCRQTNNEGRCRRRLRREARQAEKDSWGTVLKGFDRVCVSDFALWYIQTKTNLLEWHDFYCAWFDDLADLESISGEESSVLANLQTVGGNDWMVVGALADNTIYFAPDRQVVRDPTWESLWPSRMTLGDPDIWDIVLTKKHEKEIKFVKLTATRSADFQSDAKRRRRQRREERRNQIEAMYPSEEPSKWDPGSWYVRSDLLHDNKRVIETRAAQVYNYLNTRWTATVTTGLNRALTPGYTCNLAPTVDGTLSAINGLGFLVTSYAAEIDVGERTWVTILEMEEYA